MRDPVCKITRSATDPLLANAGPYDVAAIGGDLLDVGGALDPDVQIVVVEKYLKRLRRQTRLLVVSGNHDADARNAAGEWFAKWLMKARGDGLFVDWDEVSLPEVTVTLCPWWDGPVSRAELEKLLNQAATRVAGKWIWIHHAPPDRSPVSWTGSKFAGDKSHEVDSALWTGPRALWTHSQCAVLPGWLVD